MTCFESTVLLRGATIDDASGVWENQDLLIEGGVISAMGGEILLERDDVSELNLAGHVLRPMPREDVLVIRASTRGRAREAGGVALMIGEPADIVITRQNGEVLGELRDGQPVGQCFTG